MSYLRGPGRAEVQLFPPCFDDYVSANAPVRFIDEYVEGLDFKALGFTHAQPNETGRPPYHPADMIKLYLYGYLNRLRSSRRLERECGRNLEVMWLLRGIKPDFKTIADFRRDNRKAFKRLFKNFNLLLRRMNLFGAELVAIDGAKFKAVNNLQRYYTQEQLKELVKTVEERIDEYLNQLDRGDSQAEGVSEETSPEQLRGKIAQLQEYKGSYEHILDELKADNASGCGMIDLDSRKMMRRGGEALVGYNTQVAVDAKHGLIVAEDVVQDRNDRAQLAPLAIAAKEALAVEKLNVVADKGYHQADQLETCEKENIQAFVPEPGTTSGQTKDGRKVFAKEEFVYDEKSDSYQCPAHQTLTRGAVTQNRGIDQISYWNRAACKGCELRSSCTSASHRIIHRRPNEAVVQRAAVRVQSQPEIVAKRKAIVERVFGICRIWGCDKFLMIGLEKVRAEFSLSALVHNLRRVLNLKSIAQLLEALGEWRKSSSCAA